MNIQSCGINVVIINFKVHLGTQIWYHKAGPYSIIKTCQLADFLRETFKEFFIQFPDEI